ncbi:MAG: diphthine synthase [archaeon]
MLYLIGLGLNVDGISRYGLETAQRCKRIYLESYTINFPYSIGELQEIIGKRKIISADREFVESLQILDEAKKMDVALLIYGSPLTATTHITLIHEARKEGIKTKVIHNSSIFDAVAETGLQLYKFGKIASMPKWDRKKNFKPMSFMETIKDNLSMNAHTLILIDIDLEFQDALKQLEESTKENNVKIEKIIICQELGTRNKKIFYKEIKDAENCRVKFPYSIIIPAKLHFLEKEFLEEFE